MKGSCIEPAPITYYSSDNSQSWLVPSANTKLGLIHHGDQGILYASGSYLELLNRYARVRSMSVKGTCYDNVVVESFFSSLKNEIIHHRDFHTRDQARSEIFEYIELFYNRRRIHQSLAYQTPMNYDSTGGGA